MVQRRTYFLKSHTVLGSYVNCAKKNLVFQESVFAWFICKWWKEEPIFSRVRLFLLGSDINGAKRNLLCQTSGCSWFLCKWCKEEPTFSFLMSEVVPGLM